MADAKDRKLVHTKECAELYKLRGDWNKVRCFGAECKEQQLWSKVHKEDMLWYYDEWQAAVKATADAREGHAAAVMQSRDALLGFKSGPAWSGVCERCQTSSLWSNSPV